MQSTMVQNWAAVAIKLQSREENIPMWNWTIIFYWLYQPRTRRSFCWPWCVDGPVVVAGWIVNLFFHASVSIFYFNFTGFAHIGTLRFDVLGWRWLDNWCPNRSWAHALWHLTLSGVNFPSVRELLNSEWNSLSLFFIIWIGFTIIISDITTIFLHTCNCWLNRQ